MPTCTRRAFLASLAATFAAHAAEVPRRRPNVLLLLTDDQASDTLRALGNPHIRTPNLDRLAARGTAFTNCYNPGGWHGAICVASRTMLNTGRFLWDAQPLEKKRAALEATPLWPRLWREGGYATFLTGKWHVNADPKRCFDQTRHVRPGMPPTCEDAYLRPKAGAPDPWDPSDTSRPGHWSGGRHWAAVTADDAVAFLRAAPKDKPFFAYVAFNAPHDPRQAPADYQALYPPEKMPLPEDFLPAFPGAAALGSPPTLRDERLAPTPRTPHAIRTHRAEYYALVTYLDAQIGRILDALDQSGLAQDTLIAFASDNGLAVGHHQHGLGIEHIGLQLGRQGHIECVVVAEREQHDVGFLEKGRHVLYRIAFVEMDRIFHFAALHKLLHPLLLAAVADENPLDAFVVLQPLGHTHHVLEVLGLA